MQQQLALWGQKCQEMERENLHLKNQLFQCESKNIKKQEKLKDKIEELEQEKENLQAEIETLRIQEIKRNEEQKVENLEAELSKLRVAKQRLNWKNQNINEKLLKTKVSVQNIFDYLKFLTPENTNSTDLTNLSIEEMLKLINQKAKMLYDVIEKSKTFGERSKLRGNLIDPNIMMEKLINYNSDDQNIDKNLNPMGRIISELNSKI